MDKVWDKVWDTVSSYDGNKAPGPDGFNLNFIKENWKVIKVDFMKFLEEFHWNGLVVKKLNRTFIALISKCVKQKTIKDFKPISLVRNGKVFKNANADFTQAQDMLGALQAKGNRRCFGIIEEKSCACFRPISGVQYVITAEIQAISKACNLCAPRLELDGKIIKFVSDSTLAVSWINSSGFRNLEHTQTIYDIRSLQRSLGRASVVFSLRASNSFADMLAKKGVRDVGHLI
ncbi:hypothetical protein Ddye_029538 [Dipteronia dyeriana]|uniref:RNase H type-1 domain-containing protein n=1 Tax=Dipteronia dyeriana TaxID=168575 RepID=A0AAD9TFD5_9ROSI|nr:hypothetical protein Ddye_029538 [Dipteronia dyeriana]